MRLDAFLERIAFSVEAESLPAAEDIPWPGVLRLVGQGHMAGLLHVHAAPLRQGMPPDVRRQVFKPFFTTRLPASGVAGARDTENKEALCV